MSNKRDKQEALWWHNNKSAIDGLSESEEKAVRLRYGIGVQPRSTKEVAKALGVTSPKVLRMLERARIKVDREALEKSGPAMRLKQDRTLESGSLKPTLGSSAGQFIAILNHRQIYTLNDILDKSEEWLKGVGFGVSTFEKINAMLSGTGLYLRGQVPEDESKRTPWPHTVR